MKSVSFELFRSDGITVLYNATRSEHFFHTFPGLQLIKKNHIFPVKVVGAYKTYYVYEYIERNFAINLYIKHSLTVWTVESTVKI